ncbi:RNA polymerase sigma-70 factor (ECF subfamily) [Mucilaginibacter oryzae]|uniref:RNA polymerase sigma-70 factor (ECF subfamily) n=1 Tax=Mucilaginibacter oryzae TaxID=468058 RepID=A0A316H9B0_9SPHI|nr:RNA polymerase sigma-70 factor [Mucilaginibacter oryzae]PWK77047.1 RNA polymerase sigma-70 factor (ECF subfamily) [Mucilaginibacter oryzae]
MATYELLPDHELLLLLKNDDRQAYTVIYDRYKRLLFVHAYKRLTDTDTAKDVVQEIFTQLWAKRVSVVLETSLRAYLYTAVRNQIFNLIAKKQVEAKYLDSLQDFLDQSTEFADHKTRYAQLMALIESEIEQLPTKMQEVFRLSRNEQLTHKEISQKLNISEKTVKKQVQNALKILKGKLGPLLFMLML